MSKFLVIEARIPLPDGMFEEAAAIAAMKEVTADFSSRVRAAVDNEFELKVETATKRAPRATNGSGKSPGRPRKNAFTATEGVRETA